MATRYNKETSYSCSIYKYLYTSIYIQVFIYKYLYTSIYIQVFIYKYLYTSIYIQVFIYKYLYTSIYFRNSFYEGFLILTEVFPWFFLSCKANARVKLAKMGHGPHSSTLVLFVLFVCYFCYSMYCLCINVYCHRVTIQLQLSL